MTAITGMGAIASVGADVEEIFTALCDGRDGRTELRGFDRGKFTAQHLFEVDNRDGADRPGRATELLVHAIEQAAKDAGIGDDLAGVPVLIGTGLRELRSLELWWRDGAPAADLHFGPALRERFGADDTHTFANACSASLYALALGADEIDLGADTVVVAGVDVVTESMFGLSDRIQPIPPGRVLPFDANRKGTILGEGAAAVVLQRGGGNKHGVLRGVGVNCDAFHSTAPDRSGMAAAIRQAHTRAGLTPAEVDLIVMHGTGTPLNDKTEAEATREVHGEAVGRPLTTGIKSMTGHTSGSAGVLSLIVALRALATGTVPPIAGLRDPIPETDGFRLVRDAKASAGMDIAQVHGFGFGGVNAVAIVEAAR